MNIEVFNSNAAVCAGLRCEDLLEKPLELSPAEQQKLSAKEAAPEHAKRLENASKTAENM